MGADRNFTCPFLYPNEAILGCQALEIAPKTCELVKFYDR